MPRNLNDLLSIGAWINPLTGQGYSGAKRSPFDIPADSITGSALPTTPTVNQSTANPAIPTSPMVPSNNTNIATQNTTKAPTIDLTQFDTGDPLRKFNLALLDMLKKAQSGETKMGQEQAQLKKEAYQSGQQVFTGQEALMTPEAKMATLERNVAMFDPSIQAATTKIKQLDDITSLITKTYGADFTAMIPPTKEDAETFKKAMAAGWTPTADILTKYGKFFTTEDWNALVEAKTKAEIAGRAPTQPPSSYQEWTLAGGQIGTGKTYAEFITSQKAPTAAQETTALYANRLEQAESTFEQLDKYINNISAFELWKQKSLPNWLRSSEYQSLDQAQRNFVNATLRRESGAVISPAEFDNAEKQYFVQPGDKSETIAQKKLNRQQVISGFISGAGNAYTPSQYLSGQSNTDLREQVISLGYDYDKMSQQYSDEEIKQTLGL